jgi:hypothetical protein
MKLSKDYDQLKPDEDFASFSDPKSKFIKDMKVIENLCFISTKEKIINLMYLSPVHYKIKKKNGLCMYSPMFHLAQSQKGKQKGPIESFVDYLHQKIRDNIKDCEVFVSYPKPTSSRSSKNDTIETFE